MLSPVRTDLADVSHAKDVENRTPAVISISSPSLSPVNLVDHHSEDLDPLTLYDLPGELRPMIAFMTAHRQLTDSTPRAYSSANSHGLTFHPSFQTSPSRHTIILQSNEVVCFRRSVILLRGPRLSELLNTALVPQSSFLPQLPMHSSSFSSSYELPYRPKHRLSVRQMASVPYMFSKLSFRRT